MPIGVFDSGLGGLTVLDRLTAAMPNQRFVYLGDNANAPYGERPPEEVTALTRDGVASLFEAGCRLVLIACNTASAVGLRPLQQNWLPSLPALPDDPPRRVLGVFAPIVEAISAAPWAGPPSDAAPDREVVFFATPATVASGAFEREVARLAPTAVVTSRACPGLVDALEAGDQSRAEAIAASMVAQTIDDRGPPPDVAVLGCTHYPLVEGAFRRALPSETRLFSQPDIVSASLARYLERHPGYDRQSGPHVRALTTGDPRDVSRLARRFLRDGAETLTFEQV